MKKFFLALIFPILLTGCLGVRTTNIAVPVPDQPLRPTPIQETAVVHELIPDSERPNTSPTPTAYVPCDESQQIDAINNIRLILDLPDQPLTRMGATEMINSPSGDLVVIEYFDGDGRLFYVAPQICDVVEIDARFLLSTVPEDAAALPFEDVKATAFAAAAIIANGNLDALEYQEGGKIDNYFFDWYGDLPAGAMSLTRIQIGYHESGLLFAYMNTLDLEP